MEWKVAYQMVRVHWFSKYNLLLSTKIIFNRKDQHWFPQRLRDVNIISNRYHIDKHISIWHHIDNIHKNRVITHWWYSLCSIYLSSTDNMFWHVGHCRLGRCQDLAATFESLQMLSEKNSKKTCYMAKFHSQNYPSKSRYKHYTSR